MGQRDGMGGIGSWQLRGDAERLRTAPRAHDPRMGRRMINGERPAGKICIYPGCTRPAVPPHLLGGPQPSFCDLEEHNALRAHQERQRLARTGEDEGERR